MSPIAVIVLVAFVAVRWFGPGVLRRLPRRRRSSSRPDWHTWTATVAVARFVAAFLLTLRAIDRAFDPWLLVAAVALALPEVMLVAPLVWLGAPRLAHRAVLVFAPAVAVADPSAVAVLIGLRAARDDRYLPYALQVLEQRVDRVSAWTLLAVAALADRSGDRLRAAALFRQVAALPHGPSDALARARAWLAADASARGDAAALAVFCTQGDLPAIYARCRTSVLGLVGRPEWSVVAWHGFGGDALQRARRWRRASRAPEGCPAAPRPVADPLQTALHLTVFLTTKPDWALSARDVEQLARAWAEIPSEALVNRIGRRAAALEVRADPETLRRAMLAAVRPELLAILRRLREPLPRALAEGPVEEARGVLVREQSEVVTALARRVVAPTARDDLESGWEEWDAFEQGWKRFARVADRRERAYVLGDVWGLLCNHAAAIVNQHEQLLLGHLIFRWLDDACGAHGVGEGKLLRGNRMLTA